MPELVRGSKPKIENSSMESQKAELIKLGVPDTTNI